MTIKYASDEIKELLCKEYYIIKENGKKSFLDYFIKKELITQEQQEELDKYLRGAFSIIGYKNKNIEFTSYDDNYVYGKIEDTNVTFQITIRDKSNPRLITFEGNDDNYDKHNYFVSVTSGSVYNKPFKALFPQISKIEYKRGNQTTTRFNMNEVKTYNVNVKNGEKEITCLIKGNYTNEKKLDDYFANINLDKNMIQIFKDVLQISGLTIESAERITIYMGNNNYWKFANTITAEDGKLTYLAESNNGIGYTISQSNFSIFTNKVNDQENYQIDFDDKNVILNIGKNIFKVPLDILSYSFLMDYSTRLEKASEEFGNAIGKQLRKRREDISQ